MTDTPKASTLIANPTEPEAHQDSPVTQTPINAEKVEGVDSNTENPAPVEHPIITEKFEEASLTEEDLSKIKADLDSIIKSMAESQSLFTSAANYWHKLPTWTKIIAGGILVIPTLVLGIILQAPAILVICALTFLIYAGAWYFFQEHHSHESSATEALTQKIHGMVDTLGKLIQSLAQLREQLSLQINQFQQENTRLTDNVSQFGLQLEDLKAQTQKYEAIEIELRQTQQSLQGTVANLNDTIDDGKKLLELTQIELEQTKNLWRDNQNQLTQQITQLEKKQTELSTLNKQLSSTSALLNAGVQHFSENLLKDEKQQALFAEKLNAFITNADGKYTDFFDNLNETEQKLRETQGKYDEMLERFEPYVNLLEKMTAKLADIIEKYYKESQDAEFVALLNSAKTLNRVGAFGHKAQLSHTTNPEHRRDNAARLN